MNCLLHAIFYDILSPKVIYGTVHKFIEGRE